MIVNGIKYYKLSYILQNINNISLLETIFKDESGIYFWVYFPDFDPTKISKTDFKDLMLEFTNTQPFSYEEISGKYKFKAIISENNYNFDLLSYIENINSTTALPATMGSKTIFSLSIRKELSLLTELYKNKSNMKYFYDLFKQLCFYKPFYIGKANSIYTRLVNNHFKRRSSEILNEIDKSNINLAYVYVGYKLIPQGMSDDLNVVIEEIFSRTLKPGLTKKPN